MKVSFMPNLQRMAETATATAIVATVAAPPLTSENLTKLQAAQKENMDAITKEVDFDKKLELMRAGFKISNDIASEIASIQKANIAAKLKEAQDKKLAYVVNFEAAVLADAAVQSGKGNSEAKQASTDALAVLRTELQNMVLGTVAKPAGAPSTGHVTAGKGAIGAAIIELHKANLAAGKTAAESKKLITETPNPLKPGSNYALGTVGAEILAWEIETGLKQAKA